mmetsp:Transcript_33750/g.49218  ORF Transcript_33750/g.49218 Transcript_33750/m.49218 type:complete len:85 (-) Transcript_33750:120-374(-)
MREVTVYHHKNNSGGSSFISAASVEAQCRSDSVCVVPSGVLLLMDDDLDVSALVVRGEAEWTDAAQNVTCAQVISLWKGMDPSS